jgi:hypothetical protein
MHGRAATARGVDAQDDIQKDNPFICRFSCVYSLRQERSKSMDAGSMKCLSPIKAAVSLAMSASSRARSASGRCCILLIRCISCCASMRFWAKNGRPSSWKALSLRRARVSHNRQTPGNVPRENPVQHRVAHLGQVLDNELNRRDLALDDVVVGYGAGEEDLVLQSINQLGLLSPDKMKGSVNL